MSNNLTQSKTWKALEGFQYNNLNLNDLFVRDTGRFNKFSCRLNGLFFDYSKQKINDDILQTLLALAESQGVAAKRNAMFEGEKINNTEGRAVLHTALRAPQNKAVHVDSENVSNDIHATLERMKNISNQVRNRQYIGATGKIITDIVSIGIGGSDLGPRLVYDALHTTEEPIKLHFVANIDGDDLESTLNKCNPETTLFIIISKSFGTQETLTNALSAKAWMQKHLGDDTDISDHFVAVSANVEKVVNFGIKKDNIYPMWDWVNGRFSLWSAVGLPLIIGFGFDKFKDLLAGAYEMDQHFLNAPFEKNMPVLMALIGIWNINFGQCSSLAVLPYAEKLRYLPSYLQQLEMESNGKRVDRHGTRITTYETAPVLFGEAGTKGQHSFYQLLHQGHQDIPCDFIGVIHSDNPYKNHHEALMTHMLAQGQSMMQGKESPDDLSRNFPGNKPSSALLLDRLDAHHLGMLIALYEHKTAVQGFIWDLNSFDQYGVELGKEMARNIEENGPTNIDPSTAGLYSLIHKIQK